MNYINRVRCLVFQQYDRSTESLYFYSSNRTILFCAMAKFTLTMAVLLVVAAAMTVAAPTEGGDHNEETHLRVRRATCNVPVIGGLINDTACAAHCLGKGKAGGHCSDGICRCRTKTLQELFDERFG